MFSIVTSFGLYQDACFFLQIFSFHTSCCQTMEDSLVQCCWRLMKKGTNTTWFKVIQWQLNLWQHSLTLKQDQLPFCCNFMKSKYTVGWLFQCPWEWEAQLILSICVPNTQPTTAQYLLSAWRIKKMDAMKDIFLFLDTTCHFNLPVGGMHWEISPGATLHKGFTSILRMHAGMELGQWIRQNKQKIMSPRICYFLGLMSHTCAVKQLQECYQLFSPEKTWLRWYANWGEAWERYLTKEFLFKSPFHLK